MTTWSNQPPTSPGLFWFKGVRLATNNQTLRLNDIVRVQEMRVGYRGCLGVAMLGKARVYKLDAFQGVWQSLSVEVGA